VEHRTAARARVRRSKTTFKIDLLLLVVAVANFWLTHRKSIAASTRRRYSVFAAWLRERIPGKPPAAASAGVEPQPDPG
jgi:hypothetical protein